jgi:hypothetical protein
VRRSLRDNEWLSDLALLEVITGRLNRPTFNFNLEGKDRPRLFLPFLIT